MSRSFQNKFLQGSTSLTAYEKGQARNNIDVGFTGGYRNKVINGAFTIRQRGAAGSISPGVTGWVGDRWRIYNATNQTLTWNIQGGVNTSGALPTYLRTFLSWSFAVAPTAGDVYLYQYIEGANTLAANTVTTTGYFSFGVATDVLFTTFQQFGTSGSADQYLAFGDFTTIPSGFFQKKTHAATLAATTNKTFGLGDCLNFSIAIRCRHVTNYAVSGLSLVQGDATAEADPFSPRHIQQELSLCQRYFEIGWGVSSAANMYAWTSYKVTKRTASTPVISPTAGTATDASPRDDGFYALYDALNAYQWTVNAEL